LKDFKRAFRENGCAGLVLHLGRKLLKPVLQSVAKALSREPSLIYTKEGLGEKYEVGDYAYGVPTVIDYGNSKTRLVIGNFCSIASSVRILLAGEHNLTWISTWAFHVLPDNWPDDSRVVGESTGKGDVIIGNDVWIGEYATILSGVNIGDGAVIGACAVVASDVRPYAVVVGNPAREIRRRFDDETIQTLLEINWWDWPLERIKKQRALLCSGDIALLRKIAESEGDIS